VPTLLTPHLSVDRGLCQHSVVTIHTVPTLCCAVALTPHPSVDRGLCQHSVVTIQGVSTSHIAILATELHIRSSLKADVNSTIFDPIPSAASLSDPAFAQVLALTDYTIASTSLHAETDGDSLCGDSSVDPTTEVSQQLQCEMNDRKGTASLAKKFSFLAYKLQRVTAIGALSSATNGRHLGFRFWAIISASINIYAPIFTSR